MAFFPNWVEQEAVLEYRILVFICDIMPPSKKGNAKRGKNVLIETFETEIAT